MSALTPIVLTAVVTHGSTAITISGGALSTLNCAEGATVALGGVTYFVGVGGATDTTHFPIERPYEGSNGTVTCSIGQVTPEMTQRIALARALATFNASAALIAANAAGLSYAYSSATSAPISGQLAFDSANLTLAAKLRLSEADLSGQSVADRLGRWAAGDEITIRSIDGTARATYVLTAAPVDDGTYREATVAFIGLAGILAAGAQVVVERTAIGPAGAAAAISGVELALAAAHTVVLADKGNTLVSTAATSITLTLTAAATLGAAFGFVAKAGAAGSVIIDPNASETIDGAPTLTLTAGQSAFIYCTGTAWRSLFLSPVANIPANTMAGNLTGSPAPPSGNSLAAVMTALGAIGGTAGATANAVPTASGTGGKTLQASGVTIDSSNRMLIPGQPAFHAWWNQAFTATNPIAPTTSITNKGGNYNATTGIFTAPVAGTYLFLLTALNASSTTNGSSTRLYKNGVSLNIGSRACNSPLATGVMFAVLTLAANDTIQAYWVENTGWAEQPYHNFAGILLG